MWSISRVILTAALSIFTSVIDMRYLLIIVALLFTLNSWANIGSVTELTGNAIISRKNSNITVSLGTKIETNDRISTKNGKLKIRFNDNTTVTVTESSSLVVDDFVYSESTGTGKLGLSATSGTVRYVSGKIAHSDSKSVKINTPTAAIAVRGTDFVMSVAESGESLIVLMPACDLRYNINLKGDDCTTGVIDVESGGTVITLDKAYQATIVSTSGIAPTAPIIVTVDSSSVNNNLLLVSPKSADGGSTVDRRGNSDSNKGSEDSQNERRLAATQSKSNAVGETNVKTVSNLLSLAGFSVSDVTDNKNISKRYSDASETVQIGWIYNRISSSGNNQSNIFLALDTRALLVITQDMLTDVYNSNMLSTRSYGTIIINQSYR
jgi:hypothetical protein